MDNPKCFCGKETVKFKVKKQGVNCGREFCKCVKSECKFWKWTDEMNQYNPHKFKNGSCFRCGRYNCDATDCEESFDIFGNIIEDED